MPDVPAASRPKILIVDDEPYNVDFLEQELDDLGYDTVSAFDGGQALAQVRAQAPDLVLLDIMMPVMDGFAVLERLKSDTTTRDIPVVIISAVNDLSSIVKGIQLGADDYLPKPFEPVILQARIRSGLDRKLRRDLEIEYLRQVERLTAAAESEKLPLLLGVDWPVVLLGLLAYFLVAALLVSAATHRAFRADVAGRFAEVGT